MPYSVPTAAEFKQRYPAFAAVDDTLIDLVLAEASRSVGTDWAEPDYQPAIMSLAAHILFREGATGEDTGGGAGVVSSISFSGMSVSFQSTQTMNGANSEFSTTPYGRTYLRFLKANVAGAYSLGSTFHG